MLSEDLSQGLKDESAAVCSGMPLPVSVLSVVLESWGKESLLSFVSVNGALGSNAGFSVRVRRRAE